MTTGYEEATTESLLTIQGNLLNGLTIIGEHVRLGTFEVSKKPGAAPPSQAGWLDLMLLVGVEDELEGRIRGFQRTIDTKIFD